jgi:hypothetical protein
MRIWCLNGTKIMLAIIIGAGLISIGISEVSAQKKYTISYKWPEENTKYTQQYVIDVGDVPDHQIRIYEIHRVWPNDPPAFNGLQVKEEWLHGYSDYIGINGHSYGYYNYVLENGDKIYARFDGTSQTMVNSDGSKKNNFLAVITLTHGTGKVGGIRGTLRYTAIFDPKTGLNEGRVEGEYWVEN